MKGDRRRSQRSRIFQLEAPRRCVRLRGFSQAQGSPSPLDYQHHSTTVPTALHSSLPRTPLHSTRRTSSAPRSVLCPQISKTSSPSIRSRKPKTQVEKLRLAISRTTSISVSSVRIALLRAMCFCQRSRDNSARYRRASSGIRCDHKADTS